MQRHNIATTQPLECAAQALLGRDVAVVVAREDIPHHYAVALRYDLQLLARNTANLRIFEDEDGKMNKSILDIDGEVLCISQFTLAADIKKGNRPSFINAMEPAMASAYYDMYCDALKANGIKRVETGEFGADMQVSLINDGPVTIILDTDVWNKKG